MKDMKAVGSRAQVMHGTARHTAGGLFKSDLKKDGDRIKSKKASISSKKALKKNPFKKFIEYAKKSKSFKLAPKKGSVEYKKLMKK